MVKVILRAIPREREPAFSRQIFCSCRKRTIFAVTVHCRRAVPGRDWRGSRSFWSRWWVRRSILRVHDGPTAAHTAPPSCRRRPRYAIIDCSLLMTGRVAVCGAGRQARRGCRHRAVIIDPKDSRKSELELILCWCAGGEVNCEEGMCCQGGAAQ